MSFSRSQYLKAISITLLILFAVLLVAIISGWFVLSDSAKYGMVAVLLLGYSLYPIISRIGDWLDESWLGPIIDKYSRQARLARRGFEGENTVNEWLESIFPRESILPNVKFSSLSGKLFDIDFVIVSAKGVMVVEVKNLSDQLYFEGEDCYQVKEKRKFLLSRDSDPRSEVDRHVSYLRSKLQTAGVFSGRVNQVLAFSNGMATWTGKTSTYIVRDADSLRRYVEGLPEDPDCTVEIQQSIKQVLQSL